MEPGVLLPEPRHLSVRPVAERVSAVLPSASAASRLMPISATELMRVWIPRWSEVRDGSR